MEEAQEPGGSDLVHDYSSNVFEVGFHAIGFVLLFGRQETGEAIRHEARIRMNAENAKLLHFLLTDAIAQYEQRFGLIELKD